jgi:hypothetical protein
MSALTEDTITFGKYKDLSLQRMLKDRGYCRWVLKQEWFSTQYEYLYNRVVEYDPKVYFITKENVELTPLETPLEEFMEKYTYFHLTPLPDLKVELDNNEKKCYEYYLSLIQDIKDKLEYNMGENPFAIKAPTRWLKKFEQKYDLSRNMFKEFLSSYELPNIPYIIEDIKKMGGIDYKGARSYLIAKENSLKQEKFWENLLKEKYGEDVGTQFQYKKCIFDFLHINNNTIYECKIGLKDFDEDQHRKYQITLGTYDLVYLISQDCVIDIVTKTVWTTNVMYYSSYIHNIPIMKNPSKFDDLLKDFTVKEVEGEGISDYL